MIKKDVVPSKEKILFVGICRLMLEEHIFLNSSLKIDELSSRLNTNRTYISQAIKANSNCSFSDFINNARIEYAQEMMITNPQIPQTIIAEKCGFSSSAYFNKVFKKTTGLSPRIWLEKQL